MLSFATCVVCKVATPRRGYAYCRKCQAHVSHRFKPQQHHRNKCEHCGYAVWHKAHSI